MTLLLALAAATALAAPSQGGSLVFDCPINAAQVTRAADQPMTLLVNGPNRIVCVFLSHQQGLGYSGREALSQHDYRITIGASSTATVAAERRALSTAPSHGLQVFEAGFARHGVAFYSGATHLYSDDPAGALFAVLSLYFDGSHGRAWEISMVVDTKLGLNETRILAVMTRLRNLSIW